MRVFAFLGFVVAGLALGGPSMSLAQTFAPTVEKAYFEDQSGQLTVEDVTKERLTPFSGMLGGGYGSSVFWVRLKIANAASYRKDQNRFLVLRVTPTFIDRVTVYQSCGERRDVSNLGDQFPIAEQAYPALSLNLDLLPCALAEPIWLRIQSTSTRSADIAILPFDQAVEIDFRRFMLLVLAAGMILFMLLLIAVYERNIREPLLIAFALQQLALLSTMLLNNGMGRIVGILDPLAGDRISSLSTVLAELAVLYFNLRFLQNYKTSRILRPVTQMLMLVTCINIALVFTPWRGTAMYINACIIAISIVFFFAMTLTIRSNNDEDDMMSRKLVMFYYGAITLFVASPILSFFGFGTSLSLDIATTYAMFTTFVMSSMLIVRAQKRARIEENARLAMVIGLEKVEQVRKFRDQQEQLFTMLVHEVKTPIAALKIAMNNAASLDVMREKASRHLDTVTTIINHCSQAWQLEDPSFRISASCINLSPMLAKALGDHDIDIAIDTGVPEDIETDPQLFHAIVGNLVDNAVRYKAADTVPKLSVGLERRQEANGLVIEVSNWPGVSGIPDESRLFAKYYRSSNAHHTSGSGLGLFLARSSAIRLRGDLQYRFDGMIRFRLWLPL